MVCMSDKWMSNYQSDMSSSSLSDNLLSNYPSDKLSLYSDKLLYLTDRS